MDDATKRDLGGLLLGAIALALGVLLRNSENADAANIGQVAFLGGALIVLIAGVRLGLHLMSSGR